MTTQTGNVDSASQDAASKFNHSVTEKQTRQAAIEIYGTRREVALIWRQGIGLQGLNVQKRTWVIGTVSAGVSARRALNSTVQHHSDVIHPVIRSLIKGFPPANHGNTDTIDNPFRVLLNDNFMHTSSSVTPISHHCSRRGTTVTRRGNSAYMEASPAPCHIRAAVRHDFYLA
ncbi:hypothetical protein Bbelb_337740 [Branchiostoma belcheri]|nr:hypothetical protein Bbelb_337740 [Branchiostoma belcheri]